MISEDPQVSHGRTAALGLYLLAALIGGAVLTLGLRLWKADPHVPLHYALGGDSDFFLGLVQNTIETGWYSSGPRPGAPGTWDLHDFPDVVTGTFLLVTVLVFCTKDLGFVFNGFYVLTFVLATWTALFALRRLKLSGTVAVAVSLLFAFSPYHFYRGMNHPHYSAYYPIPLVVLGCLWVIGDEPMFLGRSGSGRLCWRWDRRRAIPGLVGAVLVSLAGPYYAYFGAALFGASGLIAVVRRPSRWERGLEATLLVALVAALFAAQLAPYWWFRLRHGANPHAVVRPTSDYYSYGLSLNNLLMPSAWHRLGAVRPLSLGYEPEPVVGPNSAFHGQNEAVGSNPLGLVGDLGLVALLVIGIAAPAWLARRALHLSGLSSLALAAVLFALTGGVSELIVLHVTPLFRSYNRMAVYLSFMSLLTVGLAVDLFRASWARTGLRRQMFAVLVAAGTALALWEQIPSAAVPDYRREAALFQSDRQFVQTVEAALRPGASIFQLPVVEFPEGRQHELSAFDHFRGFYHSRTLRWSFGATKGRRVAAWQAAVASQPLPEFLGEIRRAGFTGLYVNRQGYPDRGARLVTGLTKAVGPPAVTSAEGDMLFFRLNSGSPHGTPGVGAPLQQPGGIPPRPPIPPGSGSG